MVTKQQERLFKKEYAGELLGIARADLKSALLLIKENDQRKENILFHLQQSIEKAIKSVLVVNEIPVPMVHDLGVLIAKLPSNSAFPFGYELTELNDFAAIRRYEEGTAEINSQEVQIVVKQAQQILDWATKLIANS